MGDSVRARFGDRVHGANIRAVCRRRRAYWKFLRTTGLLDDHPGLRFFAAEVFHDGRISKPVLDLAHGKAVLSLVNVYCMDKLCDMVRKNHPRDKRRLRWACETRVIFRGVSEFHARMCPCDSDLCYHQSQLAAYGKDRHIRLFVKSRLFAHHNGTIDIQFASVHVEDVRPKIRKCLYLGETLSPTSVCWLKRDLSNASDSYS